MWRAWIPTICWKWVWRASMALKHSAEQLWTRTPTSPSWAPTSFATTKSGPSTSQLSIHIRIYGKNTQSDSWTVCTWWWFLSWIFIALLHRSLLLANFLVYSWKVKLEENYPTCRESYILQELLVIIRVWSCLWMLLQDAAALGAGDARLYAELGDFPHPGHGLLTEAGAVRGVRQIELDAGLLRGRERQLHVAGVWYHLRLCHEQRSGRRCSSVATHHSFSPLQHPRRLRLRPLPKPFHCCYHAITILPNGTNHMTNMNPKFSPSKYKFLLWSRSALQSNIWLLSLSLSLSKSTIIFFSSS